MTSHPVPQPDLPFRIRKIGHVVLRARDLAKLGDDEQARPASDWRWAHTLEEAVANPPPGQRPVLKDPSLLETRD